MELANRIKAAASSIEAISQTLCRANLSDAEALTVKCIYPDWNEKGHYKVDEIVFWKGNLWRCKKDHDAQDNWAPSQATASIWEAIPEEGKIEDWQPNKSYAKDVKVSHNGKIWLSMVDNNIWEPGAVGVYDTIWKEVTEVG